MSWPERFLSQIHHLVETKGLSRVHIVGHDNPSALATLLGTETSQNFALNPQVVITSSAIEAGQLRDALALFAPKRRVFVCPDYDFGIYSGLAPQARTVAEKIRWLFAAFKSVDAEIFIIPVGQALQLVPEPDEFLKNVFEYSMGDALPENIPDFLNRLGYLSVPMVEDVGTYSFRGGILDVYSPVHPQPMRIELFGDMIETAKFFDPVSQRSSDPIQKFTILPPRHSVYDENGSPDVLEKYRNALSDEQRQNTDIQEIFQALARQTYFPGIDWLLPLFYKNLSLPFSYFQKPFTLWIFNSNDCAREHDQFIESQKDEKNISRGLAINFPVEQYWVGYDEIDKLKSLVIDWSPVHIQTAFDQEGDSLVEVKTSEPTEFAKNITELLRQPSELREFLSDRFKEWWAQGFTTVVVVENQNRKQRLNLLLEDAGLDYKNLTEGESNWLEWAEQGAAHSNSILIVDGMIPRSIRWVEEKILILKDQDLLGKKKRSSSTSTTDSDVKKAFAFNFGDLKKGDLIVHKTHGIGKYEGLKIMQVNGVDSEFVEVQYREGDRLYVPVYRLAQIQKYSGPAAPTLIDKLGGNGWEKATTKVKKYLRDLASDLLKLYAERARAERPPLIGDEQEYQAFENAFPFEETEDQLKAINDVMKDLSGDKPMDRLVCGDVGFGKTEVAMRAVFRALQTGKQVAVVAPTTILTFQHTDTFKKRFQNWPYEIRTLNRFISAGDVKKTLADLKAGKVDLVIGTHRLLSNDVQFKDLGLLVIDEEQKFGVKHKERIRQMKSNVDTLVLSATPIPRTLGMSLMGIRDLSLITTPPSDRLPTRTFVAKYDSEIIRKAIKSELQRDGQVFFLHNRVQSIAGVAADLRTLLPEARIAIGHGQMDEHELEQTMVKFFNHEVDILVCTTIIESGMDIPRANTMFINEAQQLGLSQLYQLRGRVGRSKERAYCYLLVPAHRPIDKDAQERLRVIQENTALGSGIRVAQYDLELRGSGDLLGESQSGHIEAVGYELFMELLEDAVREQRGEEPKDDIEPEINVPIPALIPDNYIPDIRIRLAYYKSLSQIEFPEDIDKVESELRDQYGPPPQQVVNLMGLMLIRKLCKDLGISDLSAGKQSVSLRFTEKTKLPPNEIVRLVSNHPKRFSIAPDQRLRIKVEELTWPKLMEELESLLRLLPHEFNKI